MTSPTAPKTQTAHTPGPWGYEDPMGPDILTIVANPDAPVYEWIWVAQISTEPVEEDDGTVCDNRSFAEHEANARLMAASPELLAALTAAKQEMWMNARSAWTMADFKKWAVIQQIDAALEKADGKPRVAAEGRAP